MKIFIYKFTIIMIGLFILFQLTVGSLINEFKSEVSNLQTKEKIFTVKNKIREELKKANQKEKILDENDAKLLKTFIKKITNELNN